MQRNEGEQEPSRKGLGRPPGPCDSLIVANDAYGGIDGAATDSTYAAWVPAAVASTAGGHFHGGGVLPRIGNSVNVAVMSVAPNTNAAQGSGITLRNVPCHPNAEP